MYRRTLKRVSNAPLILQLSAQRKALFVEYSRCLFVSHTLGLEAQVMQGVSHAPSIIHLCAYRPALLGERATCREGPLIGCQVRQVVQYKRNKLLVVYIPSYV